MQSDDITCQVIETADGYSIYCPSTANWWGYIYYESYKEAHWGTQYGRKNYRFKWRAIMKAKRLEAQLNARKRELERRRNFVERKVWR